MARVRPVGPAGIADPKRISLVTPKAPFRFPKLSEPDYGNEKFPKPDGEYTVQLVMKADGSATKAFVDKFQPLYLNALAHAEAEFKKLKVDASRRSQHCRSASPNSADPLDLELDLDHRQYTRIY